MFKSRFRHGSLSGLSQSMYLILCTCPLVIVPFPAPSRITSHPPMLTECLLSQKYIYGTIDSREAICVWGMAGRGSGGRGGGEDGRGEGYLSPEIPVSPYKARRSISQLTFACVFLCCLRRVLRDHTYTVFDAYGLVGGGGGGEERVILAPGFQYHHKRQGAVYRN